jgi:hypothetical protein
MSRFTVAAASVIITSVTLAAAGWKVYTLGRTDGRSAVQVEWDKYKLDQKDVVEKEVARLQGIKDAALKESNTRAQRNAVAAQSARGELDRLRGTLALTTRADAPSCPSSAVPTSTTAAVLSECAGELVEMARKADGHLNDSLTLLKAWPVQD